MSLPCTPGGRFDTGDLAVFRAIADRPEPALAPRLWEDVDVAGIVPALAAHARFVWALPRRGRVPRARVQPALRRALRRG